MIVPVNILHTIQLRFLRWMILTIYKLLDTSCISLSESESLASLAELQKKFSMKIWNTPYTCMLIKTLIF